MSRYVLDLHDCDCSRVALVGGKAAHLGELARIDGVRVPAGFCVTTAAFADIVAAMPTIDDALDRLSCVPADDRRALRALGADLRGLIERVAVPDELSAEIADAVARFGAHAAYALRSSATAEDLPAASFAGQQDTYLNVVGAEAIVAHVSRCWASLFTDRAVAYRQRSGYSHRALQMGVVVQRMVFPSASGVVFTADPLTGNRTVASVEACFGLGEALVSGLVNADTYKVRDGAVIDRAIATKTLALHASAAGGTRQHAVEPEWQTQPALTDAQIIRIAHEARRIEAHFGGPQDIEWCLVDDDLHIVQSRRITTLFPIPAAADDDHHVYLSVGHQQMMTDAMRPLGISVWQLTASGMHEAGGRLFVDVARRLGSADTRTALLAMVGKSDPLTADALNTLIERGFVRMSTEQAAATPTVAAPPAIENDPAIVAALIARSEASLDTLTREIATKSGVALFDFILADVAEMKRILFDPASHGAIMAAMESTWWLNDQMLAWLGEKNAADVLTRSASDNVTSQMGMALLDVADLVRPHAHLVAFLERLDGDAFLDALADLPHGRAASDAIRAWLDRYGMRCVGEIDITNPRWRERPSALVPLILANVRNAEPGAAARRFVQGRIESEAKERELLDRLRALPDGAHKADETKRMIDRVRLFIGYREYPKYGLIRRYFVYKQALMAQAASLVEAGVLRAPDDIFYLRFEELHEVARTRRADAALIDERRRAFAGYRALTPPRVLTSEGECLTGAYRRGDRPAGALAGLAVSTGTIEGRARVVLDLEDADLDADDILVTAFTDPSWTPLFVAIKGLVTEVGGLMTHGAVIAREYGLPAVVGVQHATRLIRDGQRIRVNGTDGYVELLD